MNGSHSMATMNQHVSWKLNIAFWTHPNWADVFQPIFTNSSLHFVSLATVFTLMRKFAFAHLLIGHLTWLHFTSFRLSSSLASPFGHVQFTQQFNTPFLDYFNTQRPLFQWFNGRWTPVLLVGDSSTTFLLREPPGGESTLRVRVQNKTRRANHAGFRNRFLGT